MLINTDLSTETAVASRQNPRTAPGATASQTSSNSPNDSAASQLDPSLQRLAGLPAGVQDAQAEIQDQKGAGQALEFLHQSMMGQPGTAMAAQANQLSQNVFSLLQSSE
jgi:flagellin-like hook-associated protein FlgL